MKIQNRSPGGSPKFGVGVEGAESGAKGRQIRRPFFSATGVGVSYAFWTPLAGNSPAP